MKDFFRAVIDRLFEFSLLKVVAAVLCFIVFPVVVVNSGISRFFNNRYELEKEKLNFELRQNLRVMERFADSRYYSHYLLKKMCVNAEKSENWQKSIRAGISSLKKRFPDSFVFVVADSRGSLIDHLSETKDYRFLFKKTFQLAADLKASVLSDFPGHPGQIADIEKRVRVLRPLLGEILGPEDMCRPLLSLSQGRSIIASADPKKYNLWYEVNSKFSMLVFISRSFIQKKDGLDYALKMLKKQHSSREFGYCSYPADEEKIVPGGIHFDKSRIVMALSRFESFMPEDLLRDRNKVILCSPLNQKLRGFCIAPALADPAEAKMKFIASIIKFFGLSVFVLLMANLRIRVQFSIKLKLVVLLLYSILVPASIMFFLAWDQYHQTRVELVKNEHETSLKILQTLDRRFGEFSDVLSHNLRNFFDSQVRSGKKFFDHPDKISLQKKYLVDRFFVDAILLFDKEKKEVLRFDRDGLIKNSAMLKMLGGTFLKFSLGEIEQLEKDLRTLDFSEEFIRDENKVKFLGLGNFSSYSFFRVLKGAGNGGEDLVMMIFWDAERLQKIFVQKFLAGYRQLYMPRKIFSALKHDLVPIFGDSSDFMEILPAMNDAGQEKFTVYNSFRLNGKDHIAVSYIGRELDRIAFSLLMPSSYIEKEMEGIFRGGLWALFVFLLLALGAMHSARSYLLVPLRVLRESLEAFSQRDFRHRAPVICENELGKLAKTFNHSFETLEDLDVARIVQETLCPQENHSFHQIMVHVYGKTMSRLGGDCFSIARKNDRQLQIFLGDAAGHGVPAAMSVAMAKSVLLYEENESFVSGNTLERLNRVFAGSRKKRKADLMTALLLEIDGISGEFDFFNAGQLFPLIVDSKGSQTIYLEKSGFPLGFRLENSYSPLQGRLLPDERLILLTDGIIEATMPDQTPLGFERLEKMLLESFDKSLDCFKTKILNNLNNSQLQFSDDVTLIMVEYNAEKNR
ncbi:MAG: PP2C family protein-serine/threonine phosphatase [Candidatus Rifleibacteriota bacterium]